MKKCKYAGDKSDPSCKDCNGAIMIVADKEVPATECAGYEESDVDVDYKEHPVDPLSKETLKEDTNTQNTDVVVHNTSDVQNLSHVDEISFMSGVSLEHNNIWYKVEIGERRKVIPDISESQLTDEKSKLYSRINKEVDEQVTEIIKNK